MPSGNRDKKYWLFIEPYVHITSANGSFLFYNSLTKSSFELRENPDAARLAGSLSRPSSGYVTSVTASELAMPGIRKFVGKIRGKYMGDLLDASWSAGKPANIPPVPHIKTRLSRKLLDKPEKLQAIDFGNYLHEVTLYVRSGPGGFGAAYRKAEKQFLSPGLWSARPREIHRQDLAWWLDQLTAFKLATVSVTGNAPATFGGLPDIIRAGADRGYQVKLHFLYTELKDIPFDLILSGRKNQVAFYITFPVLLDQFNRVLQKIADSGHSGWYEMHFIVRNATELEGAWELVQQSGIQSYFFKPFYNGTNFDFFRENVFITGADIHASRPDQHQIFSRLTINEKDFGKLTVFPDGSVYANPNDPALGKINGDTASNIILKELLEGRSWRRTRSGVTPCRKCLYHFLCPPISGYELLMKRFNFCDVYPNPAGL
jgi:pseudo-rSAM protein